MGTTREQGVEREMKKKEQNELEFLKPTKLGGKKLAQIFRLWEQDENTMPFSVWVAKFDLKYVALDWRHCGTRQDEPMLSFFAELPQRHTRSLALTADSFFRWLPLPTIWLPDWKSDRAYSLSEALEEDKE